MTTFLVSFRILTQYFLHIQYAELTKMKIYFFLMPFRLPPFRMPCPQFFHYCLHLLKFCFSHSIVIIANNTVIYLRVAERLDLNCSHHRKEMIIMGHDGVLADSAVVIILQYTNYINICIKSTQLYT